MDGVITVMPITTVEDKAQRRLEVNARSTLMMGILDEHQLKFNSTKDAKQLLLQKLVSQLELLGEKLSQEEVNQKLLRSLSPEWNTHVVFNKVNAAKSRVTTAVRVSTAGWIKRLKDQDMTPWCIKGGPRAKSKIQEKHKSFKEVIKNGNEVLKKTVRTVEQIYKPTSVEEKLDRKKEIKFRRTLLMALPNKDQLKFHSYQDAKLLMETIEKRYGENKEYKKVQRTLLKKQYENFAASRLETLDQTFDRLQKLISQLKIQGEVIEQEDINLKMLRSLPSEWKTHALIWRNKAEIETISLQSVKERLVHYKKNKVLFDEKINILNLEVRLRDNALVEYTKKLEKLEKERDELKLTLEKYQNSSKSLNTLLESQVSDKVQTGLGYKAASPTVENFVNSSKMIKNQENVKSRSDKGYHAVPPPYTVNYIPPKPDLMFIDEQVESKFVDVVSNVSSSVVKTVESKVESVDVKNKGNPQMDLEDIGVIDSGRSRHMTGNMSYLTYYEEIDGEYAEAVNTTCYVQNKVLVVKPHNKTAYELFHGKFDGKANEGLFVGYSLNSKAFRVFNSRTRIVEENLHIRFSENTPNVVGTQSNGFAGTKASDNTDPKSSHDDGFKPLSNDRKKVDEDLSKGSEYKDQEKQDDVNSTNNVNTVSSTVNAADINKHNKLLFDPSMPALEDVGTFDFSNKDEDYDEVADMNNLDTTIQVRPTPTTRIHKDHPLDQVIGDLHSAT
uniref:Ribonuclease H-like domain-containing protein n=1 Tax=Tanacetum cinerariifolium TaxID=118510 RepID=A0A6L2P5A7_TANCI|nr:ribonuclease H-like domain-containing protein [Tanacetum cinerariifolium]